MDWQTTAVALIVAAALIYVARRGLARLRSFKGGKGGAADCATGCGKCDEAEKAATPASRSLVQIKRARD